MANSVSMSQSIAGRYAQAVFDIVKEDGGLDDLSRQTDDLNAALDDHNSLESAREVLLRFAATHSIPV